MSDEPTDYLPEDDIPEDDAVIGRAFRRSAIVIGALVLVGLAAAWWLRRAPEAPPEVVLESEAPQAVAQAAVPPAVVFRDVTRDAGIAFVHTNGAEGEKLLPETMGGGAAFFDADNDDDPDLLLVDADAWPHAKKRPSPAPASAYYRNDGHGRFTDASRESGLAVELYGTGVAIGDVDNDGFEDVYLTAVGPNRLLHNDHGRFTDVTASAGVAGGNDDWSTSAGFFDYDNDGDLDLFVCNYVRWSPEIDRKVNYVLTGLGRAYGPPLNYEGSFSLLFRNDGGGAFTDVSEASGIQIRNPATHLPMGKALGLALVDVDGDHRMDVFVANDTVANFLFHNLGDGTFEEKAAEWGLAYDRNGQATGAMGIDVAHYRNDAELGFVIGNFANEMSSLYISQGEPTLFADESIVEGVGAPSRTLLSFGVLMFDYDLDGRVDLLQTNGHLENEINTVDPSQTYEQPTQLFWNAGPEARATFVPVDPATAGDILRPVVGRGSAIADVDGDGDLDVVITQVARGPLLLRNDQQLGHHWVRFKLADPQGPSDAIGATIEVTAGGVHQVRTVMPTRSYLSQSDLAVTFGLGTAATIDAVVITWPDGSTQSLADVPIDRLVHVEKS